MYNFGTRSKRHRVTLTRRLQWVVDSVIRLFDFSITEGHRGEKLQNRYFDEGKTKVRFPGSSHNSVPSKAVDAMPWPIRYVSRNDFLKLLKATKDPEVKRQLDELLRIYHFAGIMKGVAHEQGTELRWGGDWDGDGHFDDQRFDDLPHFEEK